MLSPHTPPGTKVVCINAQDCEGYLLEGLVYTVREITAPGFGLNMTTRHLEYMHGVILEEVDAPHDNCDFHPRRFRVAALPKCLTQFLQPEMV